MSFHVCFDLKLSVLSYSRQRCIRQGAPVWALVVERLLPVEFLKCGFLTYIIKSIEQLNGMC